MPSREDAARAVAEADGTWVQPPPPSRDDEQRWVELTLGQVNDLLSMVMDRMAALVAVMGPTGPGSDPAMAARYSELLVLKGMLLLGRDDPGAA